MRKPRLGVTRSWLEETYTYDASTGRFRVVARTAPKLKLGELAGWLDKHTNRWYLSLKGAPLSMAIAVWVWHTGEYPSKDVLPLNGNPLDTRWENLALRGSFDYTLGPKISSGPLLDAELRQIFSYCPLTGKLWRRTQRGTVLMNPDSVVSLPKRYPHTPGKVPSTRLIWFLQSGRWLPTGRLIDHRNGDRTDNRWGNLRETDSQGNRANRFEPPRRFPTGARERGSRGWVGVIKHKGREIRSTPVYFTTPELAHEWFKQRHRELHGEFSPWVCRDRQQQR